MPGKKILWLCSWYPNKFDPFDGDFIQRHAKAAAMYNHIHVIHLAADITGATTLKETTIHTKENLTEQIVYYKKNESFWGRLRGHYRWLFLYRQAIRNYIVKNGKPDLVHIHVPMKAGLLGVWLKRKYKLSFVVTEHWGIYNEVAEDKYSDRSKLFKHYTKQVFQLASAFLSVSRFLADAVNRMVVKKEYQIIPNVVDTSLFRYVEKPISVFRFLHVSNMVSLKNAEGIIRSFARLHRENSATELLMVGDRNSEIHAYAQSMGISQSAIRFTGEIPYEQVAQEMQNAHCFVLFSNMENSPCVVGEALCCGLPVIATNVGGIPELVNDKNSILIAPRQDEELYNAMVQMINNYDQFNKKEIAATATSRFSYDAAGRKFDQVYLELLQEGR